MLKEKDTAMAIYQEINNPKTLEALAEYFGEKGKEHKPMTKSFILSVYNIAKNNSLLANADVKSLKSAVFTSASLQLPISQELGFAYIVPYKTKTGKVVAQFQLGYKGFIQLALRSRRFKKIVVREVREGQFLGYDNNTGEPQFDFNKNQTAKIIGYRAYIQLKDGFEAQLYMTVEELQKHAKKYSQSYRRGSGVWVDDFDAMAKKTVLKLLLARFGALSLELQRAIVEDQKAGDEYVDNKKETIKEHMKNEEIARIKKWVEKTNDIEQLLKYQDKVEATGDKELIELFENKIKTNVLDGEADK